MGVGIFHEKLVTYAESRHGHFYGIDFLMENSPELLEQNRHLIEELIRPANYFNIYLFESEETRQAFIEDKGSIENTVLLVGKPLELVNEIKLLETQYGLDVAQCAIADFSVEKQYSLRSYPLTYHRDLVIYTNQVVYMEPMMTRQFYSDFPEYKFYIKREDVLRAFTYIDDEEEKSLEMFRKRIIDEFQEGKSIFFVF